MAKSNYQKIKKYFTKILNSKNTNNLILAVALIQLILVCTIFFSLAGFKKANSISQQSAERLNTLINQQNITNERLNSLQSGMIRLQAQILRIQNSTTK